MKILAYKNAKMKPKETWRNSANLPSDILFHSCRSPEDAMNPIADEKLGATLRDLKLRIRSWRCGDDSSSERDSGPALQLRLKFSWCAYVFFHRCC